MPTLPPPRKRYVQLYCLVSTTAPELSIRSAVRTQLPSPARLMAFTRSRVLMVTFPVPSADARYVVSRLRLPWLLP